jgi:hypothetical protein
VPDEELKRIGDLDLAQDLRFERREWIVQRVAWAGMALILVAALAGVFGDGPLSRVVARSPSGRAVLHYQRFIRNHAPADLRITISGAMVERSGRASVLLSREYFGSMRLKAVTPQPAETQITPRGFVYAFLLPSRADPADIVFHFDVERVGPVSGLVSLWRVGEAPEPADTIAFEQFAYP